MDAHVNSSHPSPKAYEPFLRMQGLCYSFMTLAYGNPYVRKDASVVFFQGL